MSDSLVKECQRALLNPDETESEGQDGNNVSTAEVMQEIRAEATRSFVGYGLEFMAFFLKGRCLPLYDMVSDVIIIWGSSKRFECSSAPLSFT